MAFEIDTRLALEELDEPLRRCAKFYGLYYLVEVKNVDELSTELDEDTSNLHESFFHYGVYASLTELANFNKIIERGYDFSVPDKEKFLEKFRFKLNNPENAAELFSQMAEFRQKRYRSNTPYEDIDVLNQYITMMKEPVKLLQTCADIFSNMSWTRQYGGEPWADICMALSSRDEYTETTFVDMMWALEHNTTNWVSKIPDPGRRRYYAASREVMRRRKYNLPRELKGYEYSSEMIDAFLDVKRKGEFWNVWGFVYQSDEAFSEYDYILKDAGM